MSSHAHITIMGFTAIPPNTAVGVSAQLPVGVGTGGIAVVAVLVVVLGAFFLLHSRTSPSDDVRSTLITVAIPLVLTFVSVVVFDAFATLS